MNSTEDKDEGLELVSKSQRKREADIVRDFAARLVTESPQQLKRLPLTEEIQKAISDCPARSTRGAYKRHIQYIGKLIRKTGEFESWQQLLDQPVANTKTNPHLGFCNQLIEAFTEHADLLRTNYPQVSLQRARQLARVAAATTQEDEENADPETIALRKKADKARQELLRLLTDSTS